MRLYSMFGRRHSIKCMIVLIITVIILLNLDLILLCLDKGCHSNMDLANRQDLQEGAYLSFLHRLPNHNARLSDDYIVSEMFHSMQATCQDNEINFQHGVKIQGSGLHQNHTSEPLDKNFKFDMESEMDIMVFLHIQKTGGTTFGRHLVHNLDIPKPCVCHEHRKKCECRNSHNFVWMVSRYSTGWRCGLHADWTELTSCVDNMLDNVEGNHRQRRYLYMTILRDPFTRYLSEFKHVQRGATWKAARLQCNGRQASLEEVPFCFDGIDWSGVSLEQFINCPHNLANNRQTRMLANLSLVGCYDPVALSSDQRNCVLLNSAKENLRKMAFFGLTEYQQETQYMFEMSFGLNFKHDFFRYNHTHSSEVELTSTQRRDIIANNLLDIELYQYAKDLFFNRLHEMQMDDGKGQTNSAKRGSYINIENNMKISDSYTEEYDENDAEDDEEYNHRIAQLFQTVQSKIETQSESISHGNNIVYNNQDYYKFRQKSYQNLKLFRKNLFG